MAKPDKPTLVDGIKVEVTADAFDDFEITECIADLYDENSNDGELTNEAMSAFMASVIEAVNAKN